MLEKTKAMGIERTYIRSTGPITPEMQPYLAADPKDGKFVLLLPVECYLKDRDIITIGGEYLFGGRKELRTDGVSIPRILWSLVGIQLGGRCRAAGLVHDYLYQHCGKVVVHRMSLEEFSMISTERTFTRKECDELFLDHLLRSGLWAWRAAAAYRAVRMYFGGGKAWRGHAKRIAESA